MPLQGNLNTERICQLSQVSRAGFYRYLKGRAAIDEEMEVRSAIQEIAMEHRRRYGYRRITAALREGAMLVNHKRVLRVIAEDKLLMVDRRALWQLRNCAKPDRGLLPVLQGPLVTPTECPRDLPERLDNFRIADQPSIMAS